MVLLYSCGVLSVGNKYRDATYRDKVEQMCIKCEAPVLALRINGFYAGSRERIYLWECPTCGSLWRKARPKLKQMPSIKAGPL
jgi:hypothetical protein